MKPLSSVGAVVAVLVLSLFLFLRFVFPNTDRDPQSSKTLDPVDGVIASVEGNHSASQPLASHEFKLPDGEPVLAALPAALKPAQRERDPTDAGPKNFVADILERAADDPRLTYQLLDKYRKIENKEDKLPLISALSALILFDDNGAVVEHIILARAVDPADKDQVIWAELLREVGVRSDAARQKVLDQLALVSDPMIVADLVHSILPVEASGEEHLSVLAHLAPLTEHPSAPLRGAAIRQVSMWGGQEHIGMLENAMQDSSYEVRHAAAGAAMMSDLRSDAVKFSLLQILGNADELQDTRLQAYYALGNYKLTPIEQQQVDEWEMQEPR